MTISKLPYQLGGCKARTFERGSAKLIFLLIKIISGYKLEKNSVPVKGIVRNFLMSVGQPEWRALPTK